MRLHKEIREDNKFAGVQSDWVRKTQGRKLKYFKDVWAGHKCDLH